MGKSKATPFCFFQCLVAFQYVQKTVFTRLKLRYREKERETEKERKRQDGCLLSRHGVRLQVRTVRLLFVKQYIGFTGNDRSWRHDGHSAVVILVPFPRVRMLAVCGVMTGIRGTRMIRDTVQIVRTSRNSRGGKGTEIQTRQGKVHHHVQLATEALHRRKTFQV